MPYIAKDTTFFDYVSYCGTSHAQQLQPNDAKHRTKLNEWM